MEFLSYLYPRKQLFILRALFLHFSIRCCNSLPENPAPPLSEPAPVRVPACSAPAQNVCLPSDTVAAQMSCVCFAGFPNGTSEQILEENHIWNKYSHRTFIVIICAYVLVGYSFILIKNKFFSDHYCKFLFVFSFNKPLYGTFISLRMLKTFISNWVKEELHCDSEKNTFWLL